VTHYYCSTFSKGYAYKGLLLYNSLLRWDRDFHFFMICLHDEVKNLFERMNLKNATIISLSAVEKEDPQLQAAKKTRNDQEYAWTSKASVMLYLLNNFRDIDHIVWLDGDTFFFSDPGPIFEEWGQHSIMLNKGRWNAADKHKIDRFGRYNTGLMGFRRDKQAVGCLNWFRSRLIEWCYARHEKKLWSDQVYVNDWPERFGSVAVVKNIGINVTPPVVVDNKVTSNGKYIYVNGERLVLFHYTQFRYYDGNEFDLCGFVESLSDNVLKMIYLPYINACNEIMEQIREVDRNFYQTAGPKEQYIKNYFNLGANEKGEKFPHICTVLSKDYLIQGLALYNSLKRHTKLFQLWILCVDDTAYSLLEKMNLAGVTLVSLKNIRDKKLAKIERERKLYEFCWTLKASFIFYLLKNNYNLDSILYMDADLYFFKDARRIFSEWAEHSIFLTKLWYSKKWERKLGRYSAGLVGFKRDKAGISCLRSWRKQCLNWCYDRYENGLWGDQKYLNEWPRKFPKVKISDNKGINAGSWNVRRGARVHTENEVFYFDGVELVCFHYSGFHVINETEFELCKWSQKAAKADIVYSVYENEIRQITAQVKYVDNNFFNSLKGKCRV
jgi:hypothetical protein